MALAADPIASLVDTAFIGHIGPVELATVGVAIAVFNQASKIAIFPLVSVTNSFVAEEDTTKNLRCEVQEIEIMENGIAADNEKEELLPKVEFTFAETSPKVLGSEVIGAPAVLLSLAMQGVFCGFKDTKTPLYATIIGDVANIILDPIFIFVLGLGVTGAATAHVISQYLISLILVWRLMAEVDLLPPRIKDLQFSRFLKNISDFAKETIS